MAEQMDLVLERLGRIESALTQLLGQKTAKEWYTTDEVAAMAKPSLRSANGAVIVVSAARRRAAAAGNTRPG